MFKESNKFEKFESKVWLSSPTMHLLRAVEWWSDCKWRISTG